MFCIKCGSSLEDGVNYCPECGAAQKSESFPKVRFNKKAVFILMFVGIAAIAITTALFSSSSINSSPEKLSAAVVKALYEVDVEKMVQASPDYMLRKNAYAYDLPESATRKQITNAMKKHVKEMGEQSQKVKIVNCEITGRVDVDNMLWDYYGMTRDEYDMITDTAVVEVECILEQDKMWHVISCIEMNDKWYVLDMD